VSFAQCSSPVAGSLNPLLLCTKWMLAALPHHRECNNLHRWAYLDQNRYRARYPDHWKGPHWEELFANVYIRPANWRFENVELRKCYRLGQVACRAMVDLALESTLCADRVEVHLFLCISSESADSLWCHFGKEGSWTFGYDKALPVVFVSLPSPFYAQETQHPASSPLGPWRVVCWWGILFPLLRRAKSSFFGHCAQIQRQSHVGLFQLYLTSSPCHSCRHVENLQHIRCCF